MKHSTQPVNGVIEGNVGQLLSANGVLIFVNATEVKGSI